MDGSASRPLFWCAIIAQAQVFFWDALPDYQELTAGVVVVTPRDFVFALFGLVLMQSAYWYARRASATNPVSSPGRVRSCPAVS